MSDVFETVPPQQSDKPTTLIGETSYGAEIELAQSNTETSIMFARKKRKKEINVVVSTIGKDVTLAVLSVKYPRWPRVLEKTTLSFEEARIFRDLLTRPEIAALLDREVI